MFTGIIEEIGYVKSFVKNSSGAELVIKCSKVLNDTKIGDSICVNGVCTTVEKFTNSDFCVKLSDETLNITSLKNMKSGQAVNLERALTINTRLGGHIVSGHIDCIAKIVDIEKLSNFYNLSFEIPLDNIKYIVYKGSITVNGISLTVAKINDNVITVAIIPHTYENTNLQYLSNGDFVNIETDLIGKYVEKLLGLGDNNKKSSISMEFLQENGFV